MSILKFDTRRTWHFGKNSARNIRISLAGWTERPHISLTVDGGDGNVMLHLACFLGVWIMFENCIPNSWYPTYRSHQYGDLPDERAFKIYWFEWAIWWNFWMREGEWNSTDPKWRRNSIHFDRLLMGRHTCKWHELETREFILPFFEGCYQVTAIKKLRIDSWRRWPTRKAIAYEVKCPAGVPHMGKGESSWDCGEDATYSISFGINRDIQSPYQAALEFWKSCMSVRERYGSPRWVPGKYKDTPLNIIKPKISAPVDINPGDRDSPSFGLTL